MIILVSILREEVRRLMVIRLEMTMLTIFLPFPSSDWTIIWSDEMIILDDSMIIWSEKDYSLESLVKQLSDLTQWFLSVILLICLYWSWWEESKLGLIKPWSRQSRCSSYRIVQLSGWKNISFDHIDILSLFIIIIHILLLLIFYCYWYIITFVMISYHYDICDTYVSWCHDEYK